MKAAGRSVKREYEQFVRDAYAEREVRNFEALCAGTPPTDQEIEKVETAIANAEFNAMLARGNVAEIDAWEAKTRAEMVELEESTRSQTVAGCRTMHSRGKR